MQESNTISLQEDEIDLRELARTIGRHKKKLVGFVFVITLLSIMWTLSKPNIYHSQSVLIPQEQSKSASLGGLSALAGMAGVEIGGGEMSPDQAYQLYLNDYQWMRKFLLETKLYERIHEKNRDRNYKFALGYDGMYQIMKSNPREGDREKQLFDTFQEVSKKLSIGSDKKTSVITIGYSDPDAVLAKEVVETFLSYASDSLRANELLDMEKKITYYNEELQKNNDITLKTQLSQLMSALIQKKVLAQSGDFYNVKMITAPSVAYERDKEGPKRGMIVIVTMITSLIVGIFGIFLLEFLRKEPKAAGNI